MLEDELLRYSPESIDAFLEDARLLLDAARERMNLCDDEDAENYLWRCNEILGQLAQLADIQALSDPDIVATKQVYND